jgi:hypothetical protein
MTTFTTEDRLSAMTWSTDTPKYPRYKAADVVVELLREWCPNEEPDVWVEFRRVDTQSLHTCRKEAFLSRYSPTVS